MICRVCLGESYTTLNIFDENGKPSDIAHVLRKHLWFEPYPEDSISTVVCCNCWQNVYDFDQFYVKAEQAHIILSRTNATTISEVNIESNFTVGPQATETIDIKEELMENIFEGIFEEIEKKIEINPLDFIDATNCKPSEETLLSKEKLDDQLNAELDTEVNGKRILRRKAQAHSKSPTMLNERPSKRHNLNKKNSIFDNNKELKVLKQNELSAVATYLNVRKRQRNITDRELDLIAKHISMQCELCYFITTNYNDFVDHFRQRHKGVSPNVKCCGRKLNKRFLFIQHALKHEDPEHFKCNECNKVFSVADSLRCHMLEHHAPKEKLKYVCDLCPKRFSKQHFLNLHKTCHIPSDEWTFLCENCPQPKYFASNHLLQMHRNVCHLKAANVCHVCAKEIRDKTSFEKHLRMHFEDSAPRIKCPHEGCDSFLKDKDNLKTHMRRHNEEGQAFICNHCNKPCKNRNALTSHIHYVHNNKTYNCHLCDKSFKKAITLKEHMVQHTGGVLYQCAFCTRTFNSNANMHSHKKKMHPVEWDDWRKTKNQQLMQLERTK